MNRAYRPGRGICAQTALRGMENHTWRYEQTPFFPELTEKWVRLIGYNRDKKSIFVAGHAGQGKTASILQYLTESGIPHIHIRLTWADKDDDVLISKINHLLNRAMNRQSEDQKTVKPGATARSDQVSVKIAKDFLADLPEGFTFFWDDIHVLHEVSRGISFIGQLLQLSPANIHFIFAGRTAQNTDQLFQYQAEKTCLIDASRPHILFETYYRWTDSWQLSLSIDQVGRLYHLCDDWIAGGLLVAQYLRSLDVSDRERFFDNLETGILPSVMIRFFDREVMSAYSMQVQKQLILLAVPEFIDLKSSRPVRFLQEKKRVIDMARSNLLFLREEAYSLTGHGLRFNRLFRSYLLARFSEQYQEEEKQKIYLQCGASYVEAGKALLAVGPYLQAGNIITAKTILIRHAENALRNYDCLNIGHWLAYFNEQELLGDPWVVLFHCAGHRFSLMKDKILLLENAIAAFISQRSLTGSMLAVALLIETIMLSGDASGTMPRLHEIATSLLKHEYAVHCPYANALLRILLGAYHVFFSGELQRARDHLWKANILSRQIKDRGLQAYALAILCVSSSLAKDQADSDEFKALLAGQVSKGIPDIMALVAHCGLAVVEIVMTTNPHVAEWLQKLKKRTELTSMALLRPFIRLAEALLHFKIGRFGPAVAIMRQLVQFAHCANHPFFKNLCYRYLAQIAYFENNLDEAESYLANCEKPDVDEPIGLHQARIVQLQAILDLRSGRLDQARQVLVRLQREFERHLNHVSVVENYLLMGMLAHAQGDRGECIHWLDSGLTIAAREEIKTFMIMSPHDIVQAGILAIENIEAGSAAYAEALLTGPFSQAACDYFEGLCANNDHTLQERLVQIQKRAILKNRPMITVRTLGDFTVSRSGNPIDALQWSGLYPQLLLKAIISRGCKNVLLDQLTEDLWPDHEPQKAMQTFRVTLHRLRKTIEPDISKTLGSSYVFFRDGVVSLNEQLVSVDTVQYTAMIEQAQKVANRGQTAQALKICREADAMYQGDFLPGELYNQWADLQRDKLLKLRMQQLMLMADILEAECGLMEAVVALDKLVALDPYNELFYRKLIMIYIKLGMRAKAVAAFNTCREILKSELDTDPDPETLSVYERYLNYNEI